MWHLFHSSPESSFVSETMFTLCRDYVGNEPCSGVASSVMKPLWQIYVGVVRYHNMLIFGTIKIISGISLTKQKPNPLASQSSSLVIWGHLHVYHILPPLSCPRFNSCNQTNNPINLPHRSLFGPNPQYTLDAAMFCSLNLNKHGRRHLSFPAVATSQDSNCYFREMITSPGLSLPHFLAQRMERAVLCPLRFISPVTHSRYTH